jgi:phosphohistidine phosphatase
MRLYFLRHADALDGTDDAARPLSPKGRQQSRAIGRLLEDAELVMEAAYSSPLVRARQTAEIVLDICGKVDEIRIVDELLNGPAEREFEGWLRTLPDKKHILLVGHEPSLSERVRSLVGISDEEGFRFSKGALACVDTADGRRGRLKFLLTPRLLRS